jgi:hypothetical protein
MMEGIASPLKSVPPGARDWQNGLEHRKRARQVHLGFRISCSRDVRKLGSTNRFAGLILQLLEHIARSHVAAKWSIAAI